MLQWKKDINSKNKVFLIHSLCPYNRFLRGKCKDLQRKGRIRQVFCLRAVATIKVTENSPAIKILHERDLMVYQECAPDSVWKIISFFRFVIVNINFRLYANPWQTLAADPWQTTASSFWITYLYKLCLYSWHACWLLPLGLVNDYHSLLGLSVVLSLPFIPAFFTVYSK